jgi:hypothetical protein
MVRVPVRQPINVRRQQGGESVATAQRLLARLHCEACAVERGMAARPDHVLREARTLVRDFSFDAQVATVFDDMALLGAGFGSVDVSFEWYNFLRTGAVK